MTSQQREIEIVCVCVFVRMRKSDQLQGRWGGDLSSRIASFCQKAFMLAPRVTLCYRQMCGWHLNTLTDRHAHTNCAKSVCVTLTVGFSVVTLGRGVSSVANSNPDHSLWISYLLQSYKKRKRRRRKKKTGTYLGDTSGFGFLGSRTPHLNLSPLKPRNKTPSDMHVGWSIFWSTNLHPSCPLIDWPQKIHCLCVCD